MHPLIIHAGRVFDVAPATIIGRDRSRHVVAARKGAAWALRQRYQDMSLVSIGAELGGRDHSTIHSLISGAEERAAADDEYAARLGAILDGSGLINRGNRLIVLAVELDPEEYQTAARGAAGMLDYYARKGFDMGWSLEQELIALLRRTLAEERARQRERDKLARELGPRQAAAAAVVGLGDEAPAAPEWLRELMEDAGL